MLRKLTVAALLLTLVGVGASAQNNAATVIGNASKAMGVDSLNAITYSGTANNGAFGQSKDINVPLGPVNVTRVTAYTRTINFGQTDTPMSLVSRASGPQQPPTTPGQPAPMPTQLNQNITAMQVGANWAQALNVWTTPWGFLKGAAANNATARAQGGQQVVTWTVPNLKSPSGMPYTVTGYINNQNLVTKVETKVEHNIYGDLLVEFDYANYQNMNGVQVPTRITQRQGGLETFNAAITAATPNPANLTELLTPPPAPARGGGAPGGGAPPAGAPAQGGRGAAGAPPAPGAGAPPAGGGRAGGGAPGGGGGPQAAAAPAVDKLGEGVFKIGGNYTSLAIDMGDHILVIESGQSDARGLAVMAAAKQAIPNKRITQVVISHPHFDHAGGIQVAAAEGATILIARNSQQYLQRALAGPRTLTTDALSKVANPRVQVQAVGDREVLRGSNGKVVELHRLDNEHTNSLLMVYLPTEKILWTADITATPMATPAQLDIVRLMLAASTRLNLAWDNMIPAHALNPERLQPRTEVQMLAGPATN